jgi:hypothetical protein
MEGVADELYNVLEYPCVHHSFVCLCVFIVLVLRRIAAAEAAHRAADERAGAAEQQAADLRAAAVTSTQDVARLRAEVAATLADASGLRARCVCVWAHVFVLVF